MRRKTPVVKKNNLIAHLIYDHITAGYGVRHCYHQLGRVLWPHGNVLRKSGTQQGIRAGGTSLEIHLALQNVFKISKFRHSQIVTNEFYPLRVHPEGYTFSKLI